jgi:large subunit ribosomal protein L16
MAMMPKRVKHRKQQRGRIRGLAHRGNRVVFGDYGLQSLDEAWLDARVIEAGRVAATRFLGGEGRLYIRVFPHKSVTCIPPETRMGKGKGEPEYWAAVLKPGTVIYEIGGVPEDVAKTAFVRVAHKLPVNTRLIRRRTATS